MKKTTVLFLAAAIVAFLSGCISRPAALSTIGPDPASRAAPSPGDNGRLQVFSAAQIRAGENTSADYNGYFHPHSSYEVENDAGRTVKYVRNRASFMDETPDVVKLPAGHYKVVAESTCCGLIAVPVVIEPGKATVVHLDGNWLPSHKASPDQLVYLPNGESAGWSGATSKQ